jgi:hypothetical protein
MWFAEIYLDFCQFWSNCESPRVSLAFLFVTVVFHRAAVRRDLATLFSLEVYSFCYLFTEELSVEIREVGSGERCLK